MGIRFYIVLIKNSVLSSPILVFVRFFSFGYVFTKLCRFKEFLDKWRQGFEGLGYCDHIKELALGSVLRVTALWDSGSCGFGLLRCGSHNWRIINQPQHRHPSHCGVSIMVVKRYENTQNKFFFFFFGQTQNTFS